MGAEVPAVPEPSLPVTPAAGASPQGSGALPPIDVVTPRLSAIIPTELFRCASVGTGPAKTHRTGNKPTASSFRWSEADASSQPSYISSVLPWLGLAFVPQHIPGSSMTDMLSIVIPAGLQHCALVAQTRSRAHLLRRRQRPLPR